MFLTLLITDASWDEWIIYVFITKPFTSMFSTSSCGIYLQLNGRMGWGFCRKTKPSVLEPCTEFSPPFFFLEVLYSVLLWLCMLFASENFTLHLDTPILTFAAKQQKSNSARGKKNQHFLRQLYEAIHTTMQTVIGT